MSIAKMDVKSVSISATKIGVDGKAVPLGVVAYYHRNPLMRLLHRVKQGSLKITTFFWSKSWQLF